MILITYLLVQLSLENAFDPRFLTYFYRSIRIHISIVCIDNYLLSIAYLCCKLAIKLGKNYFQDGGIQIQVLPKPR